MTNREAVLNAIKAQGKRDAQNLQQKINSLTDTQIIQQEMKIPFFDSNKDYSEWEIGSVVKDENQVWQLVKKYSGVFAARPSMQRIFWRPLHTKDAQAAKEWIEPTENSPYMKDEVYTDGINVYRCLEDNTLNDVTISPALWAIE